MLATWAQQQTLLYLFTEEAVAPRPTQWFVALHTGEPGGGGDNEVTPALDPAYSRQEVTFEVTPEGVRYQAGSEQDVTFGPAGEGAGYVATHVSVVDSATEGIILAAAPLPVPIPVTEGGMVTIPLGELVVEGGV